MERILLWHPTNGLFVLCDTAAPLVAAITADDYSKVVPDKRVMNWTNLSWQACDNIIAGCGGTPVGPPAA